MGGPYALELHITAPIRSCGHRTCMGAEADQGSLIAKPLPTELSDIELVADDSHVRVTRVADVRIMCPDDRLGAGTARLKQVYEGLEHVRVAQVPGLCAAVVHDAIVPLG